MNYLSNQRFLNNEFREVVETAPPIVRCVSRNKEPRQETIYLVATWYAPHGRWIINNSNHYADEGAAHRRAKWIVDNVAGNTEAVVVKVCLGPNASNDGSAIS